MDATDAKVVTVSRDEEVIVTGGEEGTVWIRVVSGSVTADICLGVAEADAVIEAIKDMRAE